MTILAHRTHQFRIHPTEAQIPALETMLDRCRMLYNAALEQRITAYKRCGKSLSYFDQTKEVTALRREFPEFKAMNSDLLRSTVKRLDLAFQSFFRRIKHRKKPGFPRFKCEDRFRTLEFKDNGWRYDPANSRLFITGVGNMRVKAYRELPGTLKRIRIIKKADGWYADFICVDVPTEPLPTTGKEIGIDLGIKNLVTTSNGDTLGDIGPARQAEKRLRMAQKNLSHKKKGSNRHKKAKQIVARRWLDLARSRKAMLDRISKKLIDENDVIAVEDLNIKSMIAGTHRSIRRDIGLAGWGRLIQMIVYKAESAGRTVIKVNPRGTTQDCSRCGTTVPKDLSVRIHACPECGLVLDRDLNAAINVFQRGLRLRRGEELKSDSSMMREDLAEMAVTDRPFF